MMPSQKNTHRTLVSELVDDDMLELVEMFVEELPDKMASIDQALRAEDVATLGTLVHQLKGSAGGYGFPSITAAAKIVETSAKTGEDLETIAKHARTLADLCGRAQARADTE